MIEFSANTFRRLQGITKPDETTELVVRRLLDFFDSKSSPASTEPKSETNEPDWSKLNEAFTIEAFEKDEKLRITVLENAKKAPMIFPHTAIPPLRHTKCLSVKIDGEKFPKPRWNLAIRTILKQVEASSITSSYFHRLRIMDGERYDQGWNYISEIDKSVQGTDADTSGKAFFAIAEEYQIPVEVSFQWRENSDADQPGLRGVIAFPS